MVKNIAVITQGYYPNMSPVSAVLDKYIQALKGKYHFHIIALQSKTSYRQLEDPDLTIYDITSFWWRLRLKYEEICKKNPSVISKSVLFLIRLRGFILGIVEDYGQLKWMEKSSYSILKKISKDVHIDTVISASGLHLFLHNGAMRYKVEHPHVKWITFVTDPITFSSSKFKLIDINRKRKFEAKYKKEKDIYDTADYNIFTEALYDDALAKFCQPKNKTIQFKFVLDNLQVNQCRTNSCDNSSLIKLVYAGTLYRQIRNPEYMLSIVSRISTLHLDLYVRSIQCMDILEKYKSNRIVINDGVDIKRYYQMICNEYDILINIGNNCENQLPSKTLELLSSGRPIINFYYYKDSQYEMIEKYPLGLNVGRGDYDARNKVEKFCDEMKGKQLPYEEVVKLYPDNSLDYYKKILVDLIES